MVQGLGKTEPGNGTAQWSKFLLRVRTSLLRKISPLPLHLLFSVLALSLSEAAQPFRQHGCASQIISNGTAAITGKHHHVFSSIRWCRWAPCIQGRSAGGTETAGAEVFVTSYRLATTWKNIQNDSLIGSANSVPRPQNSLSRF